MKKYKVESTSTSGNFQVSCDENKLEFYKALCKFDAIQAKGQCFYREYPLTGAKKNYYAENSTSLTEGELKLLKDYIN